MTHPQPIQRQLFPGRERVPAPRAERIVHPGERLLRALRRRWLVALAAFVLTAASVCAAVALLPPQYQAQASVEFSTPPELLHTADADPLSVATPDDLHTLEWQFGSRASALATVAALHFDRAAGAASPAQAAADQLLQHLQLDPVEQSRVLVLRYRDRDPHRAAQVVNTLVAVTLRQWQQQRLRGLDQAQAQLGQQLQQAQQSLEASQQNLHALAAADPEVLSGDTDGASSAADRLRALEAARTQTGIQAAHLQAALQSGESAAAGAALPEGLGSDLTAQLLLRRADAEARIRRLAAQYVPTALPLVQARQELAAIDASLHRYRAAGLQREQQQLRVSQAEQVRLDTAIQQQQQRLAAQQMARLRYAGLQRASAAAVQLCHQLEVRRQQLAVLASWTPVPARLIDAATPPIAPARPRLALTLVAALMVAGVAAPGIAFLVDHLDGRLHLPEAAELGVPLLATISRSLFTSSASLRTVNRTLDPVLIAMRMTAQNYGSQLFTVAVPQSRDGRNAVIASLAQSLADTGDAVLVIDADQYRSYYPDASELTNVSGLAEVIAGKLTVDAAMLRVSSSVRPGKWELLPTGDPTSISAQIFLTSPAHDLLAAFRRQYRWVLLACEPVLQGVNTRVLLDISDASILVLPPAGHVRSNAREAVRLLREWRAPVLGVLQIVEDRPQVLLPQQDISDWSVLNRRGFDLTNTSKTDEHPARQKQQIKTDS